MIQIDFQAMEIEKAVNYTLSALTLDEKSLARGLLENRQFYEKTATVILFFRVRRFNGYLLISDIGMASKARH